MGTLSGAEHISQSCRQSIRTPEPVWGRVSDPSSRAKLDRFLAGATKSSRASLGRDGSETRPYTIHNYFFGSFTSDASITAAGPEIPPSLRTRQKCTIISTEATIGIPMQCQM